MKGEQETKMVVEVEEEDDYEQKLEFVNPIAKPMANKKLVKRLFKCIKKGKFFEPILGKNFTLKFDD